jgi:NADPH:quinone reductase-like Zn-dependent oxidoreductase
MTVMAAQSAKQSLLPETMIAARVHQFGPASAITLETMPMPQPDDNEVLVRVRAAGVGPWDSWIRAGRSVLPQPLPLTLGSDLSGTVAAIGRGVTNFAVGDAVFGVTNPRFTGAYAEYAVAAEGMIARRPSSLSDVDAASMPVIAVTAWQALFDEARLSSGAKVLIHGGAGNVGRYAIQFARAADLHTMVTAKTRDVADVRSLGADLVIDVQAERFEEKVGGVDAVIDLVGGDILARSYSVLKPGGILVSAVAAPDQEIARRYGIAAHFFLVKVTGDRLARISAMIDAGELCTKVGKVLPLSAVQEAHEMLDGVRLRPGGKIVLRID